MEVLAGSVTIDVGVLRFKVGRMADKRTMCMICDVPSSHLFDQYCRRGRLRFRERYIYIYIGSATYAKDQVYREERRGVYMMIIDASRKSVDADDQT